MQFRVGRHVEGDDFIASRRFRSDGKLFGQLNAAKLPRNYAFFCTIWQVLQRDAPRTILPHFGQRLDFLRSFAFVRGR
jgi:hypothetical protein